VLPFSERIDWPRAVVWADERLLTQVVPVLRAMPAERVIQMKQQCLHYYYAYFSSIDRIIRTTVEILKERIFKHCTRPSGEWNSYPGVELP
jgi:chromosome condensin MukBEF complex kleisin-like MukF subunit